MEPGQAPDVDTKALVAARVAVVQLGRLHESLSREHYMWLLAAVAVACAGLSSRGGASATLDRVG